MIDSMVVNDGESTQSVPVRVLVLPRDAVEIAARVWVHASAVAVIATWPEAAQKRLVWQAQSHAGDYPDVYPLPKPAEPHARFAQIIARVDVPNDPLSP